MTIRRGPGLFEQPKRNDDTVLRESVAVAEQTFTHDPTADGLERSEPGGTAPDRIRVTVYATPDQIDRLDLDRMRIRRTYGTAIDRTALIRGILEGYRRSGVDLVELGLSTEEELAGLVAERLKTGG